MSTELSRRALLIGGVAAVAGGAAWWARSLQEPRYGESALALARRADLVGEASELGRAYLELYPDEARPRRLAELLFEGVRLDADQMAARLAERIDTDWRELETVQVRGWILARSEGRFLALVSLVAEQVPLDR